MFWAVRTLPRTRHGRSGSRPAQAPRGFGAYPPPSARAARHRDPDQAGDGARLRGGPPRRPRRPGRGTARQHPEPDRAADRGRRVRGEVAAARGKARRAGEEGMITREFHRRLEAAETRAGQETAPDLDHLGGLSVDELHELGAAALVALGADPATAREVWKESWRVPGGRSGGWAGLVEREGDILRAYVDDLKLRVLAAGGIGGTQGSPEEAARLQDGEFRRRAVA